MGLATALAGILASAVPPLASFEVDLGLDWLFGLRGPRPTPANVVVVTIDRESSDHLGLPNEPEKWPRSLHAHLVRNLASQGAQVIAFDVIFDEPRDAEQDRLFAAAIRDAGNVVLFEYLKKDNRPVMDDDGAPVLGVSIEKRVPPIPELAEAASALAPFPLPKFPIKVSQVWLFKTGSGDVPTLPAIAFQIYARFVYEELQRLLYERPFQEAQTLQDATRTLLKQQGEVARARHLRQLLQNNPRLAESLLNRLQDATVVADSQTRSTLAALINMHSGRASRYLDFYGPPRSITTIPYHTVLQGGVDTRRDDLPYDFRGKAVFVGFSENLIPEQRDGFFTVFSQPDGLDLSGVEIAATTFANLLENRAVQPLEPLLHLLTLVLWGMVVGALLLLLPWTTLIPAAGTLAGVYLCLAYYAFARDGLWLPIVVPFFLQIPFALLSALLWQHLDTRKERHKIREAFGYYLPSRVVDEVTQNSHPITANGQLVYGICLATDADQYTRLSETLEPDRLRSLLNQYYAAIFDPVRRRGGFISDVVGDAMLAIWTTPTADQAPRTQACNAALDIIAAVKRFNRNTPQACLATRVGLHCGQMVLGNVGAGDHYEYRAVGDIVNATTRIESLNKQLGTRVLVSCEMMECLDGVFTREVGSFRLVGKTRPVIVHELVCRTQQMDTIKKDRYALFAIGLEAFRAQCWQEAAAAFKALLEQFGDDGPSRYYLRLCEKYQNEPLEASWDGIVSLGQK